MAPLPQYLSFPKVLLFLFLLSSALLASSSSLSHAQTRLPQIPAANLINLGRRSLLSKTINEVVEDEEDEAPALPKKKKVVKKDADEDDEAVALALPEKKKSSSKKQNEDDDGDEQVLPKKKKFSTSSTSSSSKYDEDGDVVSPKKKKSSSIKDDDDEEVSISSKKKKSSSLIGEDDEDVSVSSKKKKSSSSITEDDEEVSSSKKKKSSSSITEDVEEISSSGKKKSDKEGKVIKNKTSSSKNQTKLLKPVTGSGTSKNKTKLIKATSKLEADVDSDSDSTSSSKSSLTKSKLKKLDSSTSTKSSNSTKSSTNKNSSDQSKSSKTSSGAKDKTKSTKPKSSESSTTTDKSSTTAAKKQQKKAPPSPANWMFADDGDEDIVSDFRDLPTKFQKTFLPDLHRISTTSKIYITKANKDMTRSFKPYVGNKYAASIATAMSFAFIVVPLLLISLIFNKIKAYFSLQRLLIFIHIYLAIYFSILCLSSLLTGLEPLRFFYATSQSTYVWLQVLQTLGYVLYLLLLLMYLILVFSTESPLGQKFLGLAQTFVGFAVGLHYYIKVFHRVVLRQPPKTNWKVHGIYATCFLVICLLARAERRKKAYLEEGGEEGKKS